MFEHFCSITQLEELLNSNNDIKGYKIRISMRDTYELFMWVDTPEKVNDVIKYIKDKTIGLERVPGMRFIEMSRMEFVFDEELVDHDDLKDEMNKSNKKEPEYTTYPHLNSWVKNDKKNFNISTPLVTFYSYKGGVGRSTALAIAARQFAAIWDKKVVVLDFDVEAPGQYTLFKNEEKFYGVMDYLRHQLYLDRELNGEELIEYYCHKEYEAGGSVYLFNSFGTDSKDNYLENIAYVDFDMYVRTNKNYVERLLINIEKVIKPDIVLVDCRTGFSDISGMFLNVSDMVNVFFGISEQNEFGMKSILEQYKENSDEAKLYLPNYNFYFSILPQREKQERLEKEAQLKNRLFGIMNDVFGKRLYEPDFGEILIKPEFIYRNDLLEESNCDVLDEYVDNKSDISDVDFEKILSSRSKYENEELVDILKKMKSIYGKDGKFSFKTMDTIVSPVYASICDKMQRLILQNDAKLKRLYMEQVDYSKMVSFTQKILETFVEIQQNQNEKQEYSSDEIIKFIENTFISISKGLGNYSELFLEWADKFVDIKGIFTIRIFGARIDLERYNSPDILSWIDAYLSNSKGTFYERDVCVFLNEIINDYKQNYTDYLEPNNICLFPTNRLFTTKNYLAVAHKIYNELLKDESIKKYVEGFQKIGSVIFPINEDKLSRILTTELNLSGNQSDEYLDKLSEAGIIHKKGTDYVMSPLYLNVFGKKRNTPMA